MSNKFVMSIDLQACIGCNTCTISCQQENNLPLGISWIKIITLGVNGEFALAKEFFELKEDYLPLMCQHCANSPCIEVCPHDATYRDPDGGWVMHDPSLCMGCRYCMMVCPYTSVRVFSGEEVNFPVPYATGENPIIHRSKTVEKCTFCAHRVKKGLQPACVEACTIEALVFGDFNDAASKVSQLLRTRPHFQLLLEKGTEPSVYYLT